MKSLRHLLLLSLVLTAPLLCARVTWVVGGGAPYNVSAVAKHLEEMLQEPVSVIIPDKPFLSAWVNDPAGEDARLKALNESTLLLSPAAGESDDLFFMALQAVKAQRDFAKTRPIVIAAQKPVYKMNGLCNNRALQLSARMAIGADCDFAALPKVWQQVYTDDTFYNGRIPKGEAAESYIFAAGIALAIRGESFPLPRLSGIHKDLAEELIDSIRTGFALRENVLYSARFLVVHPFDVRVGNAFQAILYDGDFERAIGDALLRLAEADGRELTLHYTTDTALEIKLPSLFRTANPPEKADRAILYTRPAFKDDSGLTELEHLFDILSADARKADWIPFPLAVAEWTRRLTGRPVYAGTRPTPEAALMFASMLYLKWTGSAVIPPKATQAETIAIGIGLDIMLASRLYYAKPNAVLFRPLGANRYAFSLWRKPDEDVILHLAADNPETKPSEKYLEFDEETYWTRQTVTVEGPGTFLWKIRAKTFPGQNTGARAIPGGKTDK